MEDKIIQNRTELVGTGTEHSSGLLQSNKKPSSPSTLVHFPRPICISPDLLPDSRWSTLNLFVSDSTHRSHAGPSLISVWQQAVQTLHPFVWLHWFAAFAALRSSAALSK